ncbi:AmmeMemoRadiSam system protein B [Sulfurimonas sp. HSL3-7]|uniref:AmmeMemoRadiSam system protein B n=1 Tax=Sulfonitrofixus jiaomeiensis TaxID=3131938 RepID=UPI0031FA23E4
MSIRENAVAGSFYPASCSEIERYIAHFNTVLDENKFKSEAVELAPKAIIVPHAGYIYSGFTANVAYRSAAQKRAGVKRVVVIGPSHRVYIDGASVALFDRYDSPCGEMKIDLSLSKALKERFGFLHFAPEAHREHSTEVQVPFLQHYFPRAELVEIVYGDLDDRALSTLIDQVLEDEETLVVISTDLSHFHTKEVAQHLDSLCIQGMADLKKAEFESGCEACGMIGVKAVVDAANRAGLQSQVLDYRTSADATDDEQSVVGYVSCLIG